LYWIPKFHKNTYKDTSTLLDPVNVISSLYLCSSPKTAVKEKLRTYYTRSGVNQMCFLRNSTEFLGNLKTQNFSQINSIKTYDFSILYTIISHDKLKYRLLDIIENCFLTKMEKGKSQI
jgi:hypothetical protein